MNKRPLCPVFLGVLAAVCLYLHLFADLQTDPYAAYDGTTHTLTGTIIRYETIRAYDGTDMVCYYLQPEGSSLEVQVFPGEDGDNVYPRAGQKVKVRGVCQCFAQATNKGAFDARLYYATQGIAFRMKQAVFTEVTGPHNSFRELLLLLRARAGVALSHSMGEGDAGVMRAMLLGDQSALDDDLKQLYRQNGIIHILAVSGLHISMLGMGLYRLMTRCRIPVWCATFFSILLMVCYGALCGMSASAMRAVFMFALRLIAPVIRRSYDMLSAMSLIGILLLVRQPLYARHSGFLLSFGAIAALGLVLPALQRLCSCDVLPPAGRLRGRLYAGLLSGIAVAITTLPVYMCFYYTFPVYMIFLNLLVIPLMSLLLPAGLLAVVLYFVFPPLDVVAGYLCHGILLIYETICVAGRALPHSTWYAGAPAVWQVVVYYLLLATLVWGVQNFGHGNGDRDGIRNGIGSNVCGNGEGTKKKTRTTSKSFAPHGDTHVVQILSNFYGRSNCNKNRDRNDGKYESRNESRNGNEDEGGKGIVKKRLHRKRRYAAGLFFPAVIILSLRIAPALQITFVDVGQGDGIVIRHGAYNFLIDGGSSSKSSVGEYQILPYLKHEGIGIIDAVFISHEDEDHMNGVLELMEDMANGGIKIRHLFLPDIGRGEEVAMRAVDFAKNMNITRKNTSPLSAFDTSRDRYMELASYAHYLDIPITYLSAGEQVTQDNLVFTCLGPPGSDDGIRTDTWDANAHSMILYLEYTYPMQDDDNPAAFTALFTGDVEEEGLTALNKTLSVMQTDMQVTLLKVAHHGSKYTTDEEFLSLCTPRIAVISCGRNNRYGHPHAELLDRLTATGSRIYNTAEHGAVTVSVLRDGSRVEVETFLP